MGLSFTPDKAIECDFTYNHYAFTLEKAMEKGYEVSRLKDIEKVEDKEEVILLRHDVDLSIFKAREMAEIEYKLGVKSSYFIRLHGLYNIFDSKNYDCLKMTIAWEHEIGLHFEPEYHLSKGNLDLRKCLLQDSKILEDFLGNKITCFSVHSPTRLVELYHERIEANWLQYNVSSSSFAEGFKYISDSSRYWRDGCICNFIGKEPKLYATIHPFWWAEKRLPVVSLIEEAIRGFVL